MPKQIDVYYDGWGEHWQWGSLISSVALSGRPVIAFEYSDEARKRGLELSVYQLPLSGYKLRRDFPAHQLGLPGPVYDALPDGWGMLLMDRLFKRRGLHAARIGPLERLSYIGANAMGALSFEPVASDLTTQDEDVPLAKLAAEVQEVLRGEGGAFLQTLLRLGGSPQGARPKALLYRDPSTDVFTTMSMPGAEAWLIKFPAQHEGAEVCAIEAVYSDCLRQCGIQTPDTRYFDLPGGLAAFASKRFDRRDGIRVPIQSLAAFTGVDFRLAGTLDYTNFLRATQLCTNDVREKAIAFERVVFNIVFNNRDDHPKNFSYLMSASGHWTLSPAYDVTFCEGPGGYHQMDVMGEALEIHRKAVMALGEQEAELSGSKVSEIIDAICDVGRQFSAIASAGQAHRISDQTLRTIQDRIDANVAALRRA